MGYNLYAGHARGLGMLQSKMGQDCPSFLWNRGNAIAFNGADSSWLIVPSSVTTEANLSTGGFGQVRKLRFSALIGQFYTAAVSTPEQAKSQLDDAPIGYLGAPYKVTSIEIAPGGLVFVIEANALDQGA